MAVALAGEKRCMASAGTSAVHDHLDVDKGSGSVLGGGKGGKHGVS